MPRALCRRWIGCAAASVWSVADSVVPLAALPVPGHAALDPDLVGLPVVCVPARRRQQPGGCEARLLPSDAGVPGVEAAVDGAVPHRAAVRSDAESAGDEGDRAAAAATAASPAPCSCRIAKVFDPGSCRPLQTELTELIALMEEKELRLHHSLESVSLPFFELG